MKKKNKKYGTVFWITGLSGSGKTSLAKKIYPFVRKKYGPTLIISGNDLRDMFGLKGFTRAERFQIGRKYNKFCQGIVKNDLNIIISVVGLFHKLHSINKKTLKNYIEIFIKSKITTLTRSKKKIFYRKKTNNVWGIDLKPEFPKKPDIIITNNFKKDINHLKKELIKKITKNYSE